MVQRQGVVFSVLALVATLVALYVPRMTAPNELLVIGTLIVLMGVPHGALDTVFARTRYRLSSWQRWLGFTLTYCGVMASVALVWYYSPSLFLIGFLVLSAAHFSGDPTPGTMALSRIAYGGAVVILPALRFGPEFEHLFGVLVGPAAAGKVVPWINAAATPWLCLLAVSTVLEFRRCRRTALELTAVGLLVLCAPPLLGFTIFFCGMHSTRHIIRALSMVEPRKRTAVAAAGVVPMIGVIGLGALLWILAGSRPVETKLIQLLFVGLAALTVPHMALVEPFRLRGWRLDATEDLTSSTKR
ncbi:MAG: Brp/Blh family beta-carotene 15,15'-dioxygenase [Gemmatimonadetes bacterium]|nr:Brp/Blh family beta-carotene 15,15'-dioxygenase [Gemmatimonadota bacterium]